MLYLLNIYLFLFPLYLWASGLPQIADVLIFVGGVFYFFKKPRLLNVKTNYYLFLFVFYSTIVNLVYYSIHYEKSFFISSLRYIYLLFVFIFFTQLLIDCKNKGNFQKISKTILITSLFQLFYILFFNNKQYRSLGTFNNPNQLGYFSLLMNAINFSLYNHQKSRERKEQFIFLMILIVNFFISLLSLSNASILSNFVLLVYGLFITLDRSYYPQKLTIVILTLMFVFVFFKKASQTGFILSLRDRVGSTFNKIAHVGSIRGYSRIALHPNKLLFGAGEGFYMRFNSTNEFHSTWGNILFSYGIVGALPLLKFRRSLSSRNKIDNIIYFSIFLYGLSHNGIRSTLLWFFLALKLTLKDID